MTDEATNLLRELVACCDAAKDADFLIEPDPLIKRTQAAWQAARAHLAALPAAAPRETTLVCSTCGAQTHIHPHQIDRTHP